MTYRPAEVAALRTAMGLSMDGLAQMLGVNPRTVRSWESGRDRMSASAAEALSDLVRRHQSLVAEMVAAEVPVGVLREGDPDAPPRGWFLAAAGRAMVEAEDGIDVEWMSACDTSGRAMP